MTTGMETRAGSGELQQFVDFTAQYHESPALRVRALAEPRAVLAEHGVSVPPEADVRIVANTAETVHFIMPPDPNALLADEDLAAVAGGISTGGRTASCIISCLMCFS